MKPRNIVFLAMAIMTITLKAQPVIDEADYVPQIGDVFYFSNQDHTSPFGGNEGPAGYNVTWTPWSNPAKPFNQIFTAVSPANTPLSATFSLAEICEARQTSGDPSYEFYGLDSGYYEYNGFGDENFPAEIYQNKARVMYFPMTYGDSLHDTYQGYHIYSSTMDTFDLNGTIDATVDGYGTLNLYYGDILDQVLRYVIRDTSEYVTTSASIVTVKTSYLYIKEEIRFPVVEISYTQITYYDTSGVIYGVFGGSTAYLDSAIVSNIPTALAEEPARSNVIQVYPNPAHSNVNLTYFSNEEADYEIRLINTLGRTVKVFPGYTTTGAMTITLNLETIPKGIYQLVLIQNEVRRTCKLIVQ